MIDCQQFRDELDELAVLEPDLTLAEPLASHWRQCAACQAWIEQLRLAWLVLPAALDDPADLAPQLAPRKLEPLAATNTQPTRRRLSELSAARYLVAGVVACGLVLGTYWLQRRSQDRELANQDAAHLAALTRESEKLDAIMQQFSEKELQYTSLESLSVEEPVRGLVVYDEPSRQLHFAGFDFSSSSRFTYTLELLDQEEQRIGRAPIDIQADHVGTAVIAIASTSAPIAEVRVIRHEVTASRDETIMRGHLPR